MLSRDVRALETLCGVGVRDGDTGPYGYFVVWGIPQLRPRAESQGIYGCCCRAGCSRPSERGAKVMLHVHAHPSERCLRSLERRLSTGRFGLVAGDAGGGGGFIKTPGMPGDRIRSHTPRGDVGCSVGALCWTQVGSTLNPLLMQPDALRSYCSNPEGSRRSFFRKEIKWKGLVP